jgi:hypothetical protein
MCATTPWSFSAGSGGLMKYLSVVAAQHAQHLTGGAVLNSLRHHLDVRVVAEVFESSLDELKTHQRGPRVVLRSKMPDGVHQELYGYLCVHYAVRWLMHSVALKANADPDRLSFIRSLRVARRTTASHPGFPPSGAR